MIDPLLAIWPEGSQRGSQGNSYHNGDYFKQAMRKSCLPVGIEPAAFDIPVIVQLLDWKRIRTPASLITLSPSYPQITLRGCGKIG